MAPPEKKKAPEGDGPSCSKSVTGNTKEEPKTPIGAFSSIQEFTANGMREIMEATRAANAFPQGAARDLYCAYPSFGRVIDSQSQRILGLISKVMKFENIRGNIQNRQRDEKFEMVLECNDTIMERLNSNLDELAGVKKNIKTILVESRIEVPRHVAENIRRNAGSWNLKPDENGPVSARLISAKNIPRPQVKFCIPVDNRGDRPFMPRLKEKPNSLKPLAILPEYDDAGNITSYLHPYEFELEKFAVRDAQLKRKKPHDPAKIESTQLMHVETLPQLNKAVEELQNYSEVAVDVEHHSYRTFQGITCLVQISTYDKDYIFDALALREDMHLLNLIFTNPKVVKIFHGADLDIEWLQRDLSIYVVNMFDTHQAAKVLNFSRVGLSYLLKHYCDQDIDKTFQLADWRIRPLPDELVLYARQDTHYLVYIYECMTNDVLTAANEQPNLLRSIYQRSNEICKKRYRKPTVGPESHMDIFLKSKRIFNNRQLYALREIFHWRDSTARREDESFGYVLPNHMMMHIAENLPREMQGILACCNPVPPLVRQNLNVLHQIVLRAREQLLVKPVQIPDTIMRDAYTVKKDYNSKLHCPHDMSRCEEFRDDLPTLLNKENKLNPYVQPHLDVTKFLAVEPVLNMFDHPVQKPSDGGKLKRELHKMLAQKGQFVSPYQRYLAILPEVEKEKREEAARIEAENKLKQLCPSTPTALPVKTKDETPHPKNNDEHKYSIKETLKRKYEESVVAKKTQNSTHTPPAKCAKGTTATAAATSVIEVKDDDDDDDVKIEVIVADNSVCVIDDTSDDERMEQPSSSQRHQPQQQQAQKKKRNKNKKNKATKSFQSSDKVIPKNFNYQAVDYKRFQGGAQRAKGTELKPQFHAKNNPNKANNKKFNKLFTFSNNNGKKK